MLNQMMLMAVENNDEELLESAIASGADVNAKFCGQPHETALHLASHVKHHGAVKTLLKHGAYPETRDSRLLTPLHMAAYAGCVTTVALLLDANALLEARNNNGITALHFACGEGHDEVVSFLIEQKACLDAPAHNGLTPLHKACLYQNYRAAEILLDARADINAQKHDTGWSALSYAAAGSEELVFMLLDRGASIDFTLISRCVDGMQEVDFLSTFGSGESIKNEILNRGFVWKPDCHSRAPVTIRTVVNIVTLIRDLAPESCISFLPNELLFEIFYFLRGVAS